MCSVVLQKEPYLSIHEMRTHRRKSCISCADINCTLVNAKRIHETIAVRQLGIDVIDVSILIWFAV